MLSVKVGTAPCNWNNDDIPNYRPVTPYHEMLDQMAAAGYAWTEVTPAFPPNPAQIKADLAKRGLAPASTFCSINLRTRSRWAPGIDRALERARYLAALGTDVLIVADSGDDRRRAIAGQVRSEDGLDAESWRCLSEGLVELANACSPLGVRLVFHNHVGTFVETEAELRKLLDSVDAEHLGVCYDVGHMLYAGGDVQGLVDVYGSRIRYVHLKDVDLDVLARCRAEKLGFHDALRQGIFTEFGNGGMDFKPFFARLDALDYSGWVIVEQDTTKKTPVESATINRRYLRDKFGL